MHEMLLATQLRDQAVKFMSDNEHEMMCPDYELWMTWHDYIEEITGQPFQRYLGRMSRFSEYAGMPEILALAQQLEMRIHMHQLEEQGQSYGPKEASTSIHVLYDNNAKE